MAFSSSASEAFQPPAAKKGAANVDFVTNDHKKEGFSHSHEHTHTEWKDGKDKKWSHTHEHVHEHDGHNGHKDEFTHPAH